MGKGWIVAGILGLTFTAEARAQSMLTEYICDAAPGHYSMSRLQLGSEQREVSGVLHLEQLYRHNAWKPTAGIALNDGQNEARIIMGTNSVRKAVVKSGMAVTFSARAGKINAQNERVGLFQAELGAAIPFTFTLTDGEVKYSFADRSGSIAVELAGKIELQLSCSTGSFNFKELKQF